MSTPKLFQPVKLGRLSLEHRVVLCPMTRYKATKKGHVPVVPLMKTFYSQRASHPGSFLVTEGTFISPRAGGYDYIPGIWSQEQIDAWKEIVEGVHAQGSYIYLQLWALGRAAVVANLEPDGFPLVGPSPIALTTTKSTPRELTVPEIKEFVADYAQAAKNGIAAGFDGVELHYANGFLPDQFLQDNTNQRTDEYGGSIENRSRFPLEVIAAVVDAVGEDRTAVRISPWSTYNDMKMQDLKPQFSHFISELKKVHPNLSYLHVIEPRVRGLITFSNTNPPNEDNDFLREIWKPKLFISAGGYTRESAIERADVPEDNQLVSFGKLFIANPDLVTRLKNESILNPPDASTFYKKSDDPNVEVGYIDYPFLNEEKLSQAPDITN